MANDLAGLMHTIPDDALDSDIAIIARKGSGERYLVRQSRELA